MKDRTSCAYFDVNQICGVTGTLQEKKSEPENQEYILEGTLHLYSGGFLNLPILDWYYNMGVPRINKRIKDPEKQKAEVDKWKLQAFRKAKLKHDTRIFKVIHYLEMVRKEGKDKHISANFTGFLNDIDSYEEKPIF